ncbi:ABC transporter permease [Pseudonocardia kunmingensis]|uniref:Peptide/nickel transport system permease protein n=1 Tax=Pseudonocardia kunmingensis TaxID=630975 RepID=A0A543DIZ5_9PSEU|nr:ABC transporter permease [Pseudonocardia kunmingensis]TQM09215.1 peptide/nickel transport system permease protein [Pseudonocardia kunmingensis]
MTSAASGAGPDVVHRSPGRRALQRFVAHRLAMASLLVFVLITLVSLLAPWLAPYTYDELDLQNVNLPPTFQDWHLFGTDKVGRDYFSRVLYGTQTSVLVAVLVAILSTVIGTVVGAVSAFYSGVVDNVLMRIVDFVLTLPFLAVVLVVAAYLGGGSPVRVAVILGLLMWTTIARIVRAQCLPLREVDYVQAARVSGAGDLRIIFRHMVPNTMGAIIVNATLVVAQAILLESTLSYLGFGIDPPTPALGQLISAGQGSMLTQWWLVAVPGMMIVVLSLAINFVGDGLRDALDPSAPTGRAA